MKTTTTQPPVDVPLGYPTSQFFLDESGSKASGGRFFVVGGIKCRRPGDLGRAIKDVRDRHDFTSEFKFSDITRGRLPVYYDLIDQIEAATDVHVVACVVNRDVFNPFASGKESWRAHADVVSRLLVGNINKRELAGVLLDGISTPKGVSLAEAVRSEVNKRLGSTSLITATCLDSKSCDGLQVADLVASAIAFDRRRGVAESGGVNSNKAKVAVRLQAALGGIDFSDGRGDRSNIAVYKPPRRKPTPGRRRSDRPTRGVGSPLKVVEGSAAS